MLIRKPGMVIVCLIAIGIYAPAALADTVLRRGSSGEPDTLDPHKSTLAVESVIINEFLHGLTKMNQLGQVVPACAAHWDISEDGLTYTFTLRDDLVWSDGAPLTADDFVAGFRRLFNPSTAAINAASLFVIENARAATGGDVAIENIGVRSLGKQQLEIRLAHPEPTFLIKLTSRYTKPVPRHVIEAKGEAWTDGENIVSNGPCHSGLAVHSGNG